MSASRPTAFERSGRQRAARRKGAARDRFNRLYETLRDRICLLDYPPGTRLGEETLAAEFGVSRTPLRRVLARLEAEGLLESVQGVGTIVTDIDIEALTQVYLLRMELNVLHGKLTAVAPTAADIDGFRALYDRSTAIAAAPDMRAFAQLNIDFFKAVMALGDNEPLREMSERLFYQTSRIWLKSLPNMDFPREAEIFSREIADVLSAVELGDMEAMGHIRRSHLSMSFTRLKQGRRASSE